MKFAPSRKIKVAESFPAWYQRGYYLDDTQHWSTKRSVATNASPADYKEVTMLSTRSVRVLILLGFLLIVPTFAVASPIVFSDFGSDAASILDTVNAFRGAIGGANNGVAPGSFNTGRREISWDGGGAAAPVLVDMPKDQFQNRERNSHRQPRHSPSAAHPIRGSETSIPPIRVHSKHSANPDCSHRRIASSPSRLFPCRAQKFQPRAPHSERFSQMWS